MAINGVSTHVRISGLASGLDTDQMVSDLMKAERVPLDRIKQKKQLLVWKQTDFRTIITSLNDFNKSFMDVTNSATNMRSQAQYKKFSTSVINSSTGVASNNVSVSGTVDATVGNHTIIVKSLATSAKEISSSPISASLKSGVLNGDLALNGKSVKVTLDGVTRDITFNSDFNISDQASGDAFASTLQTLITDAFGKGLNDNPKVLVTYDNTSGKLTFNSSAGTNKVTFNSTSQNDGLGILGMTNSASNRINTSSTLADLKDSFNGGLTFYDDSGEDKIKFTINNKEFTFTSDTKLSAVISTINNDPTAKVNFAYDSVADKFTISSKQTGAGQNIKITNTWGNFFGAASATGINNQAVNFGTSGKDAEVKLDGQDLVRSSNTFTEGGVTYTLNKEDPLVENRIGLSTNVDEIFNNIKNFVNKFNEVLDKINTKLNEKYDRNYQPLTDEQKDAMDEKDIEKWEEKAKTGILKNDPSLQKLVNDIRLKLIEPIEGVNISLASIGITSKSYDDRGKLTIDEYKLKEAIRNDPDSVMDLFSKQSSTFSSYDRKLSYSDRSVRFKEEGIVNRLYDIVQDNVSIIMDSNKQKGYLLEKAGIVGDSSEYSSVLSKQIGDNDEIIYSWEDKLSKKEDAYYKKFTAMESALSKLKSQSSWIAGQLSSLGSG